MRSDSFGLRPLAVVNPYARHLTFLDDRTRARRDFPKYLTLIRTIALLHQHQRPVKTVQHNGVAVEYVEDNIPIMMAHSSSVASSAVVEVSVAGRQFTYAGLAPTPQMMPFSWDGRDAYGRPAAGAVTVRGRTGYVFPLVYATGAPPQSSRPAVSPTSGWSGLREDVS